MIWLKISSGTFPAPPAADPAQPSGLRHKAALAADRPVGRERGAYRWAKLEDMARAMRLEFADAHDAAPDVKATISVMRCADGQTASLQQAGNVQS